MDELEHLSSDLRVTVRRAGAPDPGRKCVVYWMQRSQRALDNPALETAVRAANVLRKPVVVFLAPVPYYPHANLRHYTFLNQGIEDITERLKERGIGFVVRRYPEHPLQKFCDEVLPALVIGDENPMREPAHWREVVQRFLKAPFWTVDADVIVPAKLLAKEQFAAYTARPIIRRLLPDFLKPVGNSNAQVRWRRPAGLQSLDFPCDITEGWPLDRSVSAVNSFKGGTGEALRRLRQFTKANLAQYHVYRNKPELDATSHLSPYLHFGHIGPHTIALAVQKSDAPQQAKEAFLEELIVRRELAINFVRFNSNYDNIKSAEPWARRTLAEHARDERRAYTERQLENAETHDPLWNAAQQQMVVTGWMHNYIRMYWAKKILEWSKSPAEAYRTAVYLNDKYELDGRDPNGYAGVAWAIAGKHDRAWSERPVFGKVRYMSFESTSKKFDSKRYIREIAELCGRGRVA
jgi:deoxyribodipyrimidine photo-lyase